MAVVLVGVNSTDVLGSERMLGIKARDGDGGLTTESSSSRNQRLVILPALSHTASVVLESSCEQVLGEDIALGP